MWGFWAHEPLADDIDSAPFEIPLQGLGVFACRKDAWPGFNPAFQGFGGEEGYIHEKLRQRGDRALCLPFLRWLHRFPRPLGVPYSINWDDRISNYLIGFKELGLPLNKLESHFADFLTPEAVKANMVKVERLYAYERSQLTRLTREENRAEDR